MGKEKPEKPEKPAKPEGTAEPEHEGVNPETGRRESDEWRAKADEKLDRLEKGQAGVLEKLVELLTKGSTPEGDPEKPNPKPNESGKAEGSSETEKPEPLDEWAGS